MYYKVSKSNLSFNEAINAFHQKNAIRRGVYGTVHDPSTTKLEDLKFSLEEINSNDWNILIPDDEMNIKLEEIRDIMHKINLDIDIRFYFEDKMDIDVYWNLFEEQFLINDNIKYDIMKWFYHNRYNKKELKTLLDFLENI